MSEILVHKHQWVNTGLVFLTVPEQATQVCTICGEHRLKQEEIPEKSEPTGLLCDIDGEPMTKKLFSGKVHFNCEKCEQTWIFEQDKEGGIHSSSTILKHLWPSGMKEDSEMYRHEFLPSWLEKKIFYADAAHEASFMTGIERNEFIANCQQKLDEWHQEHPLIPEQPKPKRGKPWWKIW